MTELLEAYTPTLIVVVMIGIGFVLAIYNAGD